MPDNEEKPPDAGKPDTNDSKVSTVVHTIDVPEWLHQQSDEHTRLHQRKEHDIFELTKLAEIYHILRVTNTQGTNDNNLNQRVLTPLIERMSRLVDPPYEADAVDTVEELLKKEEKGK